MYRIIRCAVLLVFRRPRPEGGLRRIVLLLQGPLLRQAAEYYQKTPAHRKTVTGPPAEAGRRRQASTPAHRKTITNPPAEASF